MFCVSNLAKPRTLYAMIQDDLAFAMGDIYAPALLSPSVLRASLYRTRVAHAFAIAATHQYRHAASVATT